MTWRSKTGISVVIPTYHREEVLLDTLAGLLLLPVRASEIVLVDQTPHHEDNTLEALSRLELSGSIKWIRLQRPSITAAMNIGLQHSCHELVLFLDDDIIPVPGLIAQHLRTHASFPELWATVGQVIQPGQQQQSASPPRRLIGLRRDFDFPFHSNRDAELENVMAGNLCVNRKRALSIGGFDENFIGPAFRFETDFARRVILAGGRIRFVGSAGVNHLRAKSGGTRAEGSHLNSASPNHGMGDYYYAFRHGTKWQAWRYSARRLVREVSTRFHLTHPWWVPVKILGEVRAIQLARSRLRAGPKLIQNPDAA